MASTTEAAATGGLWRPALSAQAVGLVALIVARATAARDAAGTAGSARLVPGGRAWLVLFGLVAVGVLLGGAAVATAAAWAVTLLLPVGLLALGGADARLAAAAAVTWTWRFLALDPADVVDAAAALGTRESLDVVLVRLAVMAIGVAAALGVTLRSTQRAAAM